VTEEAKLRGGAFRKSETVPCRGICLNVKTKGGSRLRKSQEKWIPLRKSEDPNIGLKKKKNSLDLPPPD